MMALCGLNCCNNCSRKAECGGCEKCEGHSFGGMCVAAECIKNGGLEAFYQMKQTLIDEFNGLGIKDLTVTDLNLLNGFYINLEYQLPNGQKVKLLEDNHVYLGNQIEIPGSERCYGIAADNKYLLVCEYGCHGADPEIVLYKRRKIS